MSEDDSTPRKFATGAVFPPHLVWQQGKTVASIDFVKDAEDAVR